MPRTLRLIVFGILVSLCTTGIVLAREMVQGERCIIEADETIEGTLFTFCQNLIVTGRVEGNIIGIALRATISGEVSENIYLAGTQLNLTGIVQGDLHYAGLVMNIRSQNKEQHHPVGGQIVFATLSTTLDDSLIIDGRITGAGYQLLIDAQVEEEVNFWGSAFVLNNTINSNVYATVGNPDAEGSELEPLLLPLNIQQEFIDPGLLISTSGTINGVLTYIGPVMGEISGTVNDRINYSSSTPVIIPITQEEGTLNIYISQVVREIMVLLTVGFAGIIFAPNALRTPVSNLRWRAVPSFVIGMLMFIVSFPIALILLLLTSIIVLILALLQLDGVLIVVATFLGLLDFTLIGSFYFLAIFVARAVFCLGLGRFLVHATIGLEGTQRINFLSMVVGVFVLALLAALPAIGFLFNAAALFMGLGAITSVFLEWLQYMRDTTYGNVRASQAGQTTLPPRYMPESEISAISPTTDTQVRYLPPPSSDIGLKNLPEGFDADFFFNDD